MTRWMADPREEVEAVIAEMRDEARAVNITWAPKLRDWADRLDVARSAQEQTWSEEDQAELDKETGRVPGQGTCGIARSTQPEEPSDEGERWTLYVCRLCPHGPTTRSLVCSRCGAYRLKEVEVMPVAEHVLVQEREKNADLRDVVSEEKWAAFIRWADAMPRPYENREVVDEMIDLIRDAAGVRSAPGDGEDG